MQAEGEMASDTTNRTDFVSHPINLQASCKKNVVYEPPVTTFDGLSTYTKEYTSKPMKKVEAIRPPAKRNLSAKFEGEPTYKSDYRQWDVEARKPHKANDYAAPQVPFKGIATYTTDYVQHCAPPPQSCKPSNAYKASDIPFKGVSDYRDAYRKPEGHERTRPIINKECTQRASVPMEQFSTHMRDYEWKNGGPSTTCKPIRAVIHSDSPFQDDTTHRTDYKQWPEGLLPVHAITQNGAYQPPKGAMCGDTTYMKDYTQHATTRRPAAGPNYKRTVDLPPFEGTSDYRDSYRAWRVGPRERSMGQPGSYQQSTARFEGLSTTKQHYVPHLGSRPADSCKPVTQPLRTHGDFDDATLYRMDYTKKHVDPCPAALLNTERSTFEFSRKDDQGHMHYYRATETAAKFAPEQMPPLVVAS